MASFDTPQILRKNRVSVSQLIANYELSKRWEQLDRVEVLQCKTVESIGTVVAPFLFNRTEAAERIRQRLIKAEDILIAGRTLTVVSYQTDFLQGLVDNGCVLTLIMLNPDFKDISEVELADPETLNDNLSRLRRLQSQLSNGGKVDIRLIDSVLTAGFIVADRDAPNGEIFVELTPYKCDSFSRPHFTVRRGTDPRWYEFFRKTCDRIVKESSPVED